MIDTLKNYGHIAGMVANAGVNEIKRRQTQAGVDKIKAEQARLNAERLAADAAKRAKMQQSLEGSRNERLYGNPGLERRPAPPPPPAPSQPQYMIKREEDAGLTSAPPPRVQRR